MFRVGYWLIRDHCEKHGKCLVYGSREFLASFRGALKILSEFDSAILESVVSEPWIFVFTRNSSVRNINHRIYGINEDWAQWHEYGVAIHIVFASMIAGIGKQVADDSCFDRFFSTESHNRLGAQAAIS